MKSQRAGGASTKAAWLTRQRILARVHRETMERVSIDEHAGMLAEDARRMAKAERGDRVANRIPYANEKEKRPPFGRAYRRAQGPPWER